MRVTVTSRHMGVNEAVKTYCQEKAEKLAHFYDRVRLVEVILDGHNGQHSAEMVVHSDGAKPFVAREEHTDIYAAFDLIMDKIHHQLTRHKERVRNRKHAQHHGMEPEA